MRVGFYPLPLIFHFFIFPLDKGYQIMVLLRQILKKG